MPEQDDTGKPESKSSATTQDSPDTSKDSSQSAEEHEQKEKPDKPYLLKIEDDTNLSGNKTPTFEVSFDFEELDGLAWMAEQRYTLRPGDTVSYEFKNGTVLSLSRSEDDVELKVAERVRRLRSS